MELSRQQLIDCTGCSVSDADKYLVFIFSTCKRFEINTKFRMAAFFAQIGHESLNLSVVSENLNYKAESLVRVWPKHFPNIQIANQYARQPEKIANRAYANRMGNGDEASGDGWRYRGRGFIQLTGKNNYIELTEHFKHDFVTNPNDVTEPIWCTLSAGYFWSKNSLNELADRQDFERITRRINGGVHGLEDRQRRYNKALLAL